MRNTLFVLLLYAFAPPLLAQGAPPQAAADQETYQREEQRRFEILLAHLDLPVTDITPSKK